jgi:hypothetical protein
LISRVLVWVDRHILRRSPREVTGHAAIVIGGGGISARGRVRQPAGETVESRLAALERNFEQLEGEFDQRAAELETEIKATGDELRKTRSELDAEHREREEARRDRLRSSMTDAVLRDRAVPPGSGSKRVGEPRLIPEGPLLSSNV